MVPRADGKLVDAVNALNKIANVDNVVYSAEHDGRAAAPSSVTRAASTMPIYFNHRTDERGV